MAMKVIPIKGSSKIIAKGFLRPIKNGKVFFDLMAVTLFQQSQQTFRNEGGRAGHPRWIGFGNGFGVSVYRNANTGTWAKRRGTDGSKRRRYNDGSKLLQASGLFRNSFIILKTSKRKAIVGTLMKDAKDIMRNPTRQVLFVTSKDRRLYTGKYKRFVDGEIKF